jgi:adenylylsulfate kinase
VEVFVKCPLEVCEDRDVKGMYAKARTGEIKNFTGISDPYEEPENAEIVVDTSKMTLEKEVDTIIDYLRENEYIF